MRLVFIDTETNDHPCKGAELRIVSITWLIARLDGAIEKIEDYIIRPDGFRIAYGAEQVHKISEAHARKHGHPIGDVLTMLVDDLQHPQGMTMVCHNVRFDRDVIGYELQRHGIPFDIYSLPSFDTMKSTASICKLPKARGSGHKDPKLQELHAHLFGKEFENAHTSKADVEATARCFFELRRRGLFGEIGRSVANQPVEQSRQQFAANTKKDVAKKMQPLCDADVKVTKTPPAHVEPAKQQTIAVVKPIARAEPARMTIPQPAVAPPAKQPAETMAKPTPNATGSTPAAANKMRGWIYLITNQAMPGHVLVDYCETDPIQQANKLNGPGAPFPYIVAYAALMTDPRGGVGLFTVKYSDKKQSGKWYSFAPSEAAAAIRELCEKQILYEDVQIEIEKDYKQVSDPISNAADADDLSTNDQSYVESQFVAVDLIRKAAEAGQADAQCKLGEMYDLGQGVAHNMGLALHWYKRAAEQGNLDAQYWLGCLYAGSKCGMHNPDDAAKWMALAAKQGHSRAIEWQAKTATLLAEKRIQDSIASLVIEYCPFCGSMNRIAPGKPYPCKNCNKEVPPVKLTQDKIASQSKANPNKAVNIKATDRPLSILYEEEKNKIAVANLYTSLVFCPHCGTKNRVSSPEEYICKNCNKLVNSEGRVLHGGEKTNTHANIKTKWVINLNTGELINLAAGHSYLQHQYVHISNRPIKGYEIIGSGPDVWVNDWDVTTVKN